MLTDASTPTSYDEYTIEDATAAAEAAGFTIVADGPRYGPYHGFTAERAGMRYLGMVPPVRLPPSAYIRVANRALDQDLGLLVVDSVRITLEHVLHTLSRPFKGETADGVELYTLARELTDTDGGIPVVPVEVAARWLLTTDGRLEYRVRGEPRLALSYPDRDITMTSLLARYETADGIEIRDHSGRVVDRGDSEVPIETRWTRVRQPVVPLVAAYRSELQSLELLLDQGPHPRPIGTTAWWSRPAMQTYGPSTLTAEAVDSFDNRYLRHHEDGMGAPELYGRFCRWFTAVTEVAPPAPEAVFQALGRPDVVDASGHVKPVATDRSWVLPTIDRGPAQANGGEC